MSESTAPTAPSLIPAATRHAGQALLLVVVLGFIAGALWLDRDRHQPVAGFGLVAGPGTQATEVRLEGEGSPAPNFILRTSTGKVVELADLRGQVVVLHAWTTWCVDCRDEFAAMNALAQRDDVVVFGVNAGEGASRVSAAESQYGITYTQLLDANREVLPAYDVWGYPATIVIDAEGRVQLIATGEMDADEIVATVDRLVAGEAGESIPETVRILWEGVR